jgi:hypothetical protein
VTINWGDGTASIATAITQDAGKVFHVSGSHTYAEEGKTAKPLQIIITDLGGAVSNMTSYTVTVADAVLAATPTPVTTAIEGVLFSGEVATFTDGDPQAPLSDFPLANLTINWGDGSSSKAASICQDAQKVFHISGSHTYAEEGKPVNPIQVTITDAAAPRPTPATC